jgi:hypothetical protein
LLSIYLAERRRFLNSYPAEVYAFQEIGWHAVTATEEEKEAEEEAETRRTYVPSQSLTLPIELCLDMSYQVSSVTFLYICHASL